MSLYHYTNAQAVHSILQHKKIWLTDIRFLNDEKELHDGVETFLDVLKEMSNESISHKEYTNNAVEYIQSSLSDSVSFGIDEEPIYVFSLGRSRDCLSQWRAYGNYALEFNENFLHESLTVHECIYNVDEKRKIAKKALIESIEKICEDMTGQEGCIGPDSIDSIISLIEKAATFKHDGFIEEREMRGLVNSDDNDIRYRMRENILIPYIEIEITLDCIKRIHIGPIRDQELAYASMSSFVQKIEREWQVESGNIEYCLQVERSSIPYRASS